MDHATAFLLCILLTAHLVQSLNRNQGSDTQDLKTSASAVFPYLSSSSYDVGNPIDPNNDYSTSEEEPETSQSENRQQFYRNQRPRTNRRNPPRPQPKYDDYYPTRQQFILPSARPPLVNDPRSPNYGNNIPPHARNPGPDATTIREEDIRPEIPPRNKPLPKKRPGRTQAPRPGRPDYKSISTSESKQRQIAREEDDKLFVAATGYGGSTRAQFHEQGMQGPNSYKFGYNTGDSFNPMARYEERDDDGHVRGSYSFVDPHGKLQVVHYESSPEFGFRTKGGPGAGLTG